MNDQDPIRQEIRRRQKGRSLIMAIALGAFVVLLYFITIARIGAQ